MTKHGIASSAFNAKSQRQLNDAKAPPSRGPTADATDQVACERRRVKQCEQARQREATHRERALVDAPLLERHEVRQDHLDKRERDARSCALHTSPGQHRRHVLSDGADDAADREQAEAAVEDWTAAEDVGESTAPGCARKTDRTGQPAEC